MKMRRTLPHNLLVSETCDQLRFPMKVTQRILHYGVCFIIFLHVGFWFEETNREFNRQRLHAAGRWIIKYISLCSIAHQVLIYYNIVMIQQRMPVIFVIRFNVCPAIVHSACNGNKWLLVMEYRVFRQYLLMARFSSYSKVPCYHSFIPLVNIVPARLYRTNSLKGRHGAHRTLWKNSLLL